MDEQALAIFTSDGGDIQVRVDAENETIWATRDEIAEIFGCTTENVRQHVANIYKEQDLDEGSTSKKILEVQITIRWKMRPQSTVTEARAGFVTWD